MCDRRMNGKALEPNTGLKIIAACNPYKKHSEEAIKSFEKSGLGFYVDMNETQEKLGDLPMRHLVYRVQPLAASMLPIIWDFGKLNDQVESLYISQIVNEKFGKTMDQKQLKLIVDLLSNSQIFMRKQENECSFVSLRDIQRVLKVIDWFLTKGDVIFEQINKKNPSSSIEQEDSDSEDDTISNKMSQSMTSLFTINYNFSNLTSSIILALNTCYHVGLQSEESRKKFRIEVISKCFIRNGFNNVNDNYILEVIDSCYDIFLNEIKLPDAIARNQALKENIFMMLICIELKIPLFIIGKPGSSKSLSKTLISHKMSGMDRMNSKVLSNFKEAHLITFQCSPMSTSDMILNTFRYCAKFQLEKCNELDKYTSVIVLDEIGLAEASSSMPLKTLHPLLEDGVYFDDKDEEKFGHEVEEKQIFNRQGKREDWHKIGFIGISNWVLDPAKMNRGIFVNRTNPSINELKETVEGICKNDNKVLKGFQAGLIDSLSKGYLEVCEQAKKKKRILRLERFLFYD